MFTVVKLVSWLRASHLNWALAPIGCIDEHFKNSNYKYCVSFFVR